MNKISAALALTLAALLLSPSVRAIEPMKDTMKAPDWMMKLTCEQILERQRADKHDGPSYDRNNLERASRDKGCGIRKLPKMTAEEKAKRCAVLDRDLVAMMKTMPRTAAQRHGRDLAVAERKDMGCPGPMPHPASSH